MIEGKNGGEDKDNVLKVKRRRLLPSPPPVLLHGLSFLFNLHFFPSFSTTRLLFLLLGFRLLSFLSRATNPPLPKLLGFFFASIYPFSALLLPYLLCFLCRLISILHLLSRFHFILSLSLPLWRLIFSLLLLYFFAWKLPLYIPVSSLSIFYSMQLPCSLFSLNLFYSFFSLSHSSHHSFIFSLLPLLYQPPQFGLLLP